MSSIRIAGREIGPDQPPYVIAEISANHRGSLAAAVELVHAAAESGADAVKLQHYTPDTITVRSEHPDFLVTGGTLWDGRQLADLYAEAMTPWEWHPRLMARAGELGLHCFSTPYDASAVDFLETLDVPAHKIASFELVDLPLLRKVASTGKPVILSTGMATLDEVGEALGVLAFGYLRQGQPADRSDLLDALGDPRASEVLKRRVTLLHCTSEYPCPLDQVNLRAMDSLADRFGLAVGYSDHTLGIQVSVAAAARGACVLEKHFTLDRRLPGPDHAASLEPGELAALVRAVREVSQALGQAEKAPAATEIRNAAVVRKSLVAARAISAGEPFSSANLTAKRPGIGRSPMDSWELFGTCSSRDYAADEAIE